MGPDYRPESHLTDITSKLTKFNCHTTMHSPIIEMTTEGVTQTQCDLLLEPGCDELQGYLITQPLSGPNFRLFMLRASAFASDPATD